MVTTAPKPHPRRTWKAGPLAAPHGDKDSHPTHGRVQSLRDQGTVWGWELQAEDPGSPPSRVQHKSLWIDQSEGQTGGHHT